MPTLFHRLLIIIRLQCAPKPYEQQAAFCYTTIVSSVGPLMKKNKKGHQERVCFGSHVCGLVLGVTLHTI